jgi:hypothetical protein
VDEGAAAKYIERSRKRKRSESEPVAQQYPAIVQQPPVIVQQPSVVAQQPVCCSISQQRRCQSQVQGIPTVFGMYGGKAKKTCDACCVGANARKTTHRNSTEGKKSQEKKNKEHNKEHNKENNQITADKLRQVKLDEALEYDSLISEEIDEIDEISEITSR